MRALEAALATQWCMEEKHFEQLLTIAAREHDVTHEALEAYTAKSLANSEKARVRDGVAIIDINGATFKRANLMTAMSGATSYEIIGKDFQAALDDPKVKGIMFNIDSPGGQASGVSELASMIYAARGQKPMTAYINGHGCSASYWLASAVGPVVANDTAIIGCLGVQMGLRDSGEKPGEKTYRFISSQTPMKNAGPDTESGSKAIQAEVDALAQVFLETVAVYRGVDTETVLNDFGKGGIFVGKDAVQAGLADSLGNFETVLADLSAGGRKKTGANGSTRKGTSMSDTNEQPGASASADQIATAVAAAVEKSQAAERTRTSALTKIAGAHGIAADALASAIADGTDVTTFALAAADIAVAARAEATAAAAADKATKIEALKTDETEASTAAASAGHEPGEDSVESVAAAIAAA